MSLVTLRPGLTLEAEAAASWARMEAEAGRRLDVNRSTVSRADQFKLYWAWVAYQNGTGPAAVLALHPDESWHCEPRARAVDTDDDAWIRAHPQHGWRFVVRTEKWHGQYYPEYDTRRGQGFPAGMEEDDMTPDQMIKALTDHRPFPKGRNIFDQLIFIAGMTAIAATREVDAAGSGATAEQIVDEVAKRLQD